MVVLPAIVRDALDDKVFAHLSTIMPDGAPHSSVIWIEREGDQVRFSTAEGRVKAENLRRDPRLSISLTPVGKPYHNITLLGRAVEMETDGMWLIDRLAQKYLGEDEYPWARPGQVRLNVVAEITHVSA